MFFQLLPGPWGYIKTQCLCQGAYFVFGGTDNKLGNRNPSKQVLTYKK